MEPEAPREVEPETPDEEEAEHPVTPLELFFDLVFVFALTQVTGFMSDDPTWAGIGKGMLDSRGDLVCVGRLRLAHQRDRPRRGLGPPGRFRRDGGDVRGRAGRATCVRQRRRAFRPRLFRGSRHAHRPLRGGDPPRRRSPSRVPAGENGDPRPGADRRRRLLRRLGPDRPLAPGARDRLRRAVRLRRARLLRLRRPLRRAVRPDRDHRSRRVDRRDRHRRRRDRARSNGRGRRDPRARRSPVRCGGRTSTSSRS